MADVLELWLRWSDLTKPPALRISRPFIDYTWIGVFITVQSSGVVWILHDGLGMHVAIAGLSTGLECWILRWYMLRWFKVVRE